MDQSIQKLVQKYGQKVKENVSLAPLTTLNIGGPAKGFFEAETEQELEEIIKDCQENQIQFLVIGGGSNLLVSDEGFPGLIIKNNISGINRDENTLTVYSGTILQDLVDYTIENGLGGMNKLTGIPGTVGGAVYGKAGAYGHNISDCLTQVKAFNGKELKSFSTKECEFGYRDSGFKRNGFIILEVSFELEPDDSVKMSQQSAEVLKMRVIKYPPNTMCPGSFFKNIVPDDLPASVQKNVAQYVTKFNKIPAGKLIEEVGGKGVTYKQFKISENHGNTFINLGGGKAQDFYDFANEYAQKVKEKFGVKLEPEVQFVNLPPFNL